ncbi:MAG: metallophosphoesterase [Nitrososphaerales archaeon]
MKRKSKFELIKVAKGLSIASPYPSLYLEREEALIVADLHLGLEEEQESKGIHIPFTTFPKITELVLNPCEALNCKRLIILGDVKHEFAKPLELEWFTTKRLFKMIRDIGAEPEVVKGNHDNYIAIILKEMNVKLYEEKIELDRFTLIHGHLPFDQKVRHIIMGHEHPVITIKDDLGVKHRYKAFLDGEVEGRRITVLPSVSPLALGLDINEVPSRELLSPLLKGKDLSELTPYLIEPKIAVKKFPKLKFLFLSPNLS